ncbi:hypothetical protein GCM10011367_13930 [Marinicauda pacifica]|uniref:HEAT repeat domain-containing protein n=1 Tax=Marinicauda pacifica TaxID=1133559 RepID=A0A4S2HBF6_9PROT|nr:hypothetical protein [Marinicauda pacifica]TGY92822.1 hypothetical protein E5162_07040 [Marinicauda pacifica]GGE40615.1 hypothetical protein GCM10011367_13930 [Marinicauda pacifica]
MRRKLSEDGTLEIRLMLQAGNAFQQRAALKKICELSQDGYILPRPQDLRVYVVYLTRSDEFEVRRWALKALVEIGNREDLPHIKSLLSDLEPGSELFSWAMAAFQKIARPDEREEAFTSKILPKDHLALMGFAFANPHASLPSDLPRVDIDRADEVALRWACLCMATRRGGDEIFNPKFNQKNQLIALNGHHVGEVAQYSIYTMGRRADFKFQDLGFAFDEVGARAPEIRKWTYFLFGSDLEAVERNSDILNQIISDPSPNARLGLANALKPVWFDGLDAFVVNWLDREDDEFVRTAIIEHMASFADEARAYEERCLALYRETEDKIVRAKIKVAAQGGSFYGKLIQIDHREMNGVSGLLPGVIQMTKQEFHGQTNIGVNAGRDANTGDIHQEVEISRDILNEVKSLKGLAEKEGSPEALTFKAASEELENKKSYSNAKKLGEAAKKWLSVAADGTTVAIGLKSLIAGLSLAGLL